jgi:iron complex outermembrane receptor protein
MKTHKECSLRNTILATALSLAAGPVLAQLVLEEVVVTAQKRESTVQDISATVNVLTGDSLQKFNSISFDDIQAQTAGLSLYKPSARTQSIAMRGVAIDPDSGADGTVDVYWNGQYVNLSIAFSQLYDMERIEILRGPQGSLQGRSSPGGAINVLTRKADVDEASGYVQMIAADNDALNTQVAYGAPLIDGILAVRVAAVYDTSSARDVENKTTGLDDPELEAKSARFNTVWNVTDTFSADLTYQYFDRDTDDPLAVSGVDSLGERPTLEPKDKIALASENNKAEFDYDIVNLSMNWLLGDHELASVSGWSDSTSKYLDDLDRANYVTEPQALTDQSSNVGSENWVQELRLTGSATDFWEYMVGFYYQDQDVDADLIVNTTETLSADTPVIGAYQLTVATQASIPVTAEQWSLFTFNTFDLSDELILELGLRYTDYDRTRRATVEFAGTPYLPDLEVLPPGFTQEQLKQLIIDGAKEVLPIDGIDKDNQKSSEDAWTGSLTLRWDWTDDVSLYANYNHGYRPSGISIVPHPSAQFLPNGQNDLLYDEEESDAVEVGFKGRFLDGRASLNGALYYQKYDGYLGFVRELEVLDDDRNVLVLPGGVIFNGDANVVGVDLEGQILLTETWSAGGAANWTKGEWDGAEAPCNVREAGEVVGTCDVDGENIGGEPEWSASLNSEYYFPLEDNTEVYIRGLYKFNGERDNISASAGLGEVTDKFNSYSLVDLFIGWRSADQTWDVNVFSKNLFDEDEVVFQNGSDQYDQQFSGGSYTQANVLMERTIGVTALYNF